MDKRIVEYVLTVFLLLLVVSCKNISDAQIMEAALAIEYMDIEEEEYMKLTLEHGFVEWKKEYIEFAKKDKTVNWVAETSHIEKIAAKTLISQITSEIESNRQWVSRNLSFIDESIDTLSMINYEICDYYINNFDEVISNRNYYYKHGLDYPEFVYDIKKIKKVLNSDISGGRYRRCVQLLTLMKKNRDIGRVVKFNDLIIDKAKIGSKYKVKESMSLMEQMKTKQKQIDLIHKMRQEKINKLMQRL
jgi:hypothetical protein